MNISLQNPTEDSVEPSLDTTTESTEATETNAVETNGDQTSGEVPEQTESENTQSTEPDLESSGQHCIFRHVFIFCLGIFTAYKTNIEIL